MTSLDRRPSSRASWRIVSISSLAGVTGARAELSARLPAFLERGRRQTDLPLCVGFGISRPEHVASLIGQAYAGTTLPLALGYLGIGMVVLALVYVVEGGKLFHARLA